MAHIYGHGWPVRWVEEGEGKLIDDQGTATGSRTVQACNGRGLIRVQTRKGRSVITVQAGSLPSVFLPL